MYMYSIGIFIIPVFGKSVNWKLVHTMGNSERLLIRYLSDMAPVNFSIFPFYSRSLDVSVWKLGVHEIQSGFMIEKRYLCKLCLI